MGTSVEAGISGLVTPSVGMFGLRGGTGIGPVEGRGGLVASVTVGEEGTSDRFGFNESGTGSLSPDPASVNGSAIRRLIYDTGNTDWRIELTGSLPSNHFESVEIEIDPGVFYTLFTAAATFFLSGRIWIWRSGHGTNVWTQADVGDVRSATFAW